MRRLAFALRKNGQRIDLGKRPFMLTKEPDLSGLGASLETAETSADGVLFLRSRFGVRDIDLIGFIDKTSQTDEWTERQKKKFFDMVNPKEEVELEIQNGRELFYLTCRPIAFPLFRTEREHKRRNYQTFFIQLTALDPYLYRDEKRVSFSVVRPMLSFPLKFNAVNFGEEEQSLIKSVYNGGSFESPLKIQMRARGEVKNPYLLNIYTQEKMQIDADLEYGDILTIQTGRKKEITRERNGKKEWFYHAMNLDSDFLLLQKGDNVLRVGAQEGEDNLTLTLSYHEREGGI